MNEEAPRPESYYLVLPNGTRYGPATVAEMIEWAKANHVPRGGKMMHAETGAMSAVTDFPELVAAIPVSAVERFVPRNTKAVIGYYVAVFSTIGCLFCFLPMVIGGGVAIVLGAMGLNDAKREPAMGGKKHAWFAIIAGIIEVIAGLALSAWFAVMMMGV